MEFSINEEVERYISNFSATPLPSKMRMFVLQILREQITRFSLKTGVIFQIIQCHLELIKIILKQDIAQYFSHYYL